MERLSKRASTVFTTFVEPILSSVDDIAKTNMSKTVQDVQILKTFRAQIKQGSSIIPDISALSAIVDALTHEGAIDDRKFLLEHLLTFISQLPDSEFSRGLGDKTVQLLYNDLCHPAPTLVGEQYKYREADGGSNNIDVPDLGKAGVPYSRSVQQTTPPRNYELPDPGLIFDALLKRETFKDHPAGLSSLMFSFAALVIHTVFRTRHKNVDINETSSYVDLSPLYGSNQDEQNAVRNRNGHGFLHPDTFAESRLLLLPPAVSALLILFSRNHNYIANKLLEINERGSWVDPTEIRSDNDRLMQQDEEIFQTARLCNCGWFGSVVFSDYFSAILGLVRTGNSWSLNPFGEIRKEDHSVFERGKGNSVSVEFNLLYRWHATTSQEDEKWVGDLLQRVFGDKPLEEITREDFIGAFQQMHDPNNDLNAWSLGDVKRKPNGSFPDMELAKIIQNATENPAAAFGARNTPHVMRPHEIMGMEQARKWGVCSMNDFRRFLGLKAYDSFLEWNSDPEIAGTAEKLYGEDIEQLELYPGLQAEESKPVMDGAGLCPGYTISRAILSDAVALTRGDRFFTHDFSPANLTSWGFADCQRDPNAFGFGSTLGRLFLRTLPKHFSDNSVYTFFPLMRPVAMQQHLSDMGLLDKYDLERPTRRKNTIRVKDHDDILEILKSANFQAPYATRASNVIPGNTKGFFTVESLEEQKKVTEALTSSPEIMSYISKYFAEKTRELIDENSYTLVGGQRKAIDLVRDVITMVPVYFAAEELAGIQLTTKSSRGAYTPKELNTMLGDIYSYIFLDIEPSKVMVLEGKVEKHVGELLDHIKKHMHITLFQQISFSHFMDMVASIIGTKPKAKEHHTILESLYKISNSTDQLANTVLALMVSMSMELPLAITNTLNLYLGSKYDLEFHDAATIPTPQPFDKFIWEAFRLDPPFRGVRRITVSEQQVGEAKFKPGEIAMLDIYEAHHDPNLFPAPDEINLSRPGGADHLKADSALTWIGPDLTSRIMNDTLRIILQYTNIRRGPGDSGLLQRFLDSSRTDLCYTYLDHDHITSAWPTSLVVQYDVSPQ